MTVINAELRPAWRNYWFGFLIVGVLLLMAAWAALSNSDMVAGPGAAILLLGALLVLGFVALKRHAWKFTVDDNRVARHYGLISRNQQSVRIKDLRSVELDQSALQRLFGIGDLAFYSAGSDRAEVRFVGIKRPAEWRNKIDAAADRLKSSDD